MPEFLHEVVRKRERSNHSTSDEFQTNMNAAMESAARQIREYLSADPWAAVEARNNEEHNLHYSGGAF